MRGFIKLLKDYTLEIIIGVFVIFGLLYVLGAFEEKETKAEAEVSTAPQAVGQYKKIPLELMEEWTPLIWLTAGQNIHVWGNPNVVGRSEEKGWVEYQKDSPSLWGTSYWFQFRAKEGNGTMQYCIYPKGLNPNEVCK